MQHPMRPMIRLDDVAYSTVHHAQSASAFVPGPWAGRSIALKPAPGVNWGGVSTQVGQGARLDDGWDLTGVLEPGRVNELTVSGGPIVGAVLESAHPLHIVALEAWCDSQESLSIRVGLSKAQAAVGCPGPLSLFFTLTDQRGELVSSQEVSVAETTADLAVAMPVHCEPLAKGSLKAVLILDGQVVEDVRIRTGEPYRAGTRSEGRSILLGRMQSKT